MGVIEESVEETMFHIERINEALKNGEKISFATSKADYLIQSIDADKMKASVIRKSDDKPGLLNVTGYNLEVFYKGLPRKYKKVNENIEKPKKEKKMDTVVEKVSKEKSTEKRKSASKFIKNHIKENPNCTVNDISDAMKKEEIVMSIDLKGYLNKLVRDSNENYTLTSVDGKYNITIKENNN